MKTNELRIGNLVCYLHLVEDSATCIDEVVGFDECGVALKSLHGSSIRLNDETLVVKPLELTGELLLRAGFVKDDEYPMYYKSGFTLSLSDEGYFSLHINLEYMLVKKIEHVHRLQNLWYELTGEELTIN